MGGGYTYRSPNIGHGATSLAAQIQHFFISIFAAWGLQVVDAYTGWDNKIFKGVAQTATFLEQSNMCPAELTRFMYSIAVSPRLPPIERILDHFITVVNDIIPKIEAQRGMLCRSPDGNVFTVPQFEDINHIRIYPSASCAYQPTRRTTMQDVGLSIAARVSEAETRANDAFKAGTALIPKVHSLLQETHDSLKVVQMLGLDIDPTICGKFDTIPKLVVANMCSEFDFPESSEEVFDILTRVLICNGLKRDQAFQISWGSGIKEAYFVDFKDYNVRYTVGNGSLLRSKRLDDKGLVFDIILPAQSYCDIDFSTGDFGGLFGTMINSKISHSQDFANAGKAHDAPKMNAASVPSARGRRKRKRKAKTNQVKKAKIDYKSIIKEALGRNPKININANVIKFGKLQIRPFKPAKVAEHKSICSKTAISKSKDFLYYGGGAIKATYFKSSRSQIPIIAIEFKMCQELEDCWQTLKDIFTNSNNGARLLYFSRI